MLNNLVVCSTFGMVADGRAPLAPLLTHTSRLDQLRDALLTAMDKKGSGSIKVAFRY